MERSDSSILTNNITNNPFHARFAPRQKWIDPKTAELMERERNIGVRRAEIITASASALHPIMKKVNPVAFSKANIHNTLTHPSSIPVASKIADYFIEKFNPHTGRMSVADMEEREVRRGEERKRSVVKRQQTLKRN
jgi:hypothetical protein